MNNKLWSWHGSGGTVFNDVYIDKISVVLLTTINSRTGWGRGIARTVKLNDYNPSKQNDHNIQLIQLEMYKITNAKSMYLRCSRGSNGIRLTFLACCSI